MTQSINLWSTVIRIANDYSSKIMCWKPGVDAAGYLATAVFAVIIYRKES